MGAGAQGRGLDNAARSPARLLKSCQTGLDQGSGRPFERGSELVNRHELLTMSVFTLRCSSCGAAMEIPGRFGFKLKSSGAGRLFCQRCRQSRFLKARREQLDQAIEGETLLRRSFPVTALLIAVATMTGLVWWHQAHSDRLHDALPERVSPSK